LPNVALNDVRLLEIGIVGVQNQRLALIKLAQEGARVAPVPPLGHARGVGYGFASLWIEVDLEVVSTELPKVKGFVLHLISAKVLRRYGLSAYQKR
jgi:hypothetical protein